MRRILTLSVAWAAAAIVAAVVAWQGIGLVGDQVTDNRPDTLSAAQIDAALADDGGSTTAPSTTAPAATSDTTTPGGSPPSTDAAGAGAGGTGTGATTGGTPSQGTAPAGSGGSTTAPAPAATVRNYSVTGGTATISFSPNGVTVVLATPDPGYSLSTEPEGAGVRVEFESGNIRSRIDAWWDGGPQDRVEDGGAESSGGSGADDGPG